MSSEHEPADDHDEIYDFGPEGESDEVETTTTTATAEPVNGASAAPRVEEAAPEAPRRAPPPTAKNRRPRAATASEARGLDEQEQIRSEADADLVQAEQELLLLKSAAKTMWRVSRTRVNPGHDDVDPEDPGELGDAGEVPAARYKDATRSRWGGGDYTVQGIDKAGKPFGPLSFTISGVSKPLHPEEKTSSGPSAGDVFLGAPGGAAPGGQFMTDAFGRTVAVPYPGAPQLPPHLQPPPGYSWPGTPGVVGPPQPIHPIVEALKKENGRLERELQDERQKHAQTKATLDAERAAHERQLHKSELERVRAESQAETERLRQENKAAMDRLEARLAAPKEDPHAFMREIAREAEKSREAAEARFQQLLTTLTGNKDSKFQETLLLKMLEHKQESPLAQLEMLERMAEITGKGGKDDEEEQSTVEKLVGGLANVLSRPAPPFPQQPLVPAVGYAANQPQALPAPAPQQLLTTTATAVPQAAPAPPPVPTVAGLSEVQVKWLVLINQIYGLVQAGEYPASAGQKLKTWAAANPAYQPLLADLARMQPAQAVASLQGIESGPFASMLPDQSRAEVRHLVGVFQSPQTQQWVAAFWDELKK